MVGNYQIAYEQEFTRSCGAPTVARNIWRMLQRQRLAQDQGSCNAVEVPSANSLKECWDLVNTSERTRRHCVILENCCYDFFEMMSLQLAQQGALGEVLHAEGSYHHNLDFYWNQYWEDWRLQFNATHRGDLYPTHGLGPVAQALDINRGDRFTSLVAMDTKSVNGKEVGGHGGEFPPSAVFPDRDRKSQQSPPD